MSTWEQMTKEILTDIVRILAADNSGRYMVGIVQWQGKIIGRPIYQPSPFELTYGSPTERASGTVRSTLTCSRAGRKGKMRSATTVRISCRRGRSL